jgi:predicted ribosomally synthesized peptide with SipW-like signal peptide
MTNNNKIPLSRRSVLGGLGAIGVASAGAGLGTTAFFSDNESFENNTITAGGVELRMDWQQSYYTGISGQDPEDHTTWEPINAYPDLDGDNRQDRIYTRFQLAEDPTLVGLPVDADDEEIEQAYRGQFASFEETNGSGNTPFVGPVINLDDVKPGDRGEITISKHVFDNPAYLWLNASGFENTIGELNEPKRAALVDRYSAELGDSFTDADLIALAEAEAQFAKEIEATLWYDDDCNNFFDGGSPSCIQFVVDNTDSMGSQAPGSFTELKDELLIEALETYVGRLDTKDGTEPADGDTGLFSVGLTNWTTVADTVLTPTSTAADIVGTDGGSYTDSTGLQTINYQDEIIGGTDLPNAIEAGASVLGGCPEDEDRIMVLITNGINVDTSDFLASASANLRSNGGEVDQFLIIGFGTSADDAQTLGEISTLPGNHAFMLVSGSNIDAAINGPTDPNTEPVTSVAEEIGFTAGGEETIFEGSLYDLLTQPAGITDGSVEGYQVDGIAEGYPLDADRNRDGRQCYPNSDTRCIALEWHLPFEVGNEIQGDSAVFSLDFYAEQCRHNDGSHNPFVEAAD